MNYTKKQRAKSEVTNAIPAGDMTVKRSAFLSAQRARRMIKRIIWLVILVVVAFYAYKYIDQYFLREVDVDSRLDRTSIHYVTDLYYSDGRYYDEYLNDNEKRLYLALLSDIKEAETESRINCVDYGYSTYSECATSIAFLSKILILDHPDMFWYDSSSYQSRVDRSYIKIAHSYTTRSSITIKLIEARMLRKLDEIASEMADLSDYEKVKAVYDWYGSNVRYSAYDTRATDSALNVLLKGNGTPKGFAMASQLLFQRLGIDSTIIAGSKDGLDHYWNLVFIEDGYYWFDASLGTKDRKNNPNFYDGFINVDQTEYGVNILNLNKYTLGEKYLES